MARLLPALLVAAAACAAAPPSPPPAPPEVPLPAAPAKPGRYGPEPRLVPEPLERSAMAAAADALARDGRRPVASPALVLAARRLARRAALGDPSPLGPHKLRAALSEALSYDPAPAAFLVAGPADQAVESLVRAISPREASHVGAGVAARGATTFLVLLASRRGAVLHPFPREVAPGERATLRGELGSLRQPLVFLTLPSGQVREVPARGSRSFQADIAFGGPGRYVVEVVGRGPTGPDVAALFQVSCGGASLEAGPEAPLPAEPVDPAEAETQVVAAINALRRRDGLGALAASPALREVARRHSAAMLARRQLAHILPGSGDAAERLRRDRVPFRMVLENIALGSTSLAAHAAAEESPAHRDNILSPAVTLVGAGTARGRLPTGEPVVYLTEIFVQPVDDASEGPLTPEGRVRQAIWRERERLHLSPLLSDGALDDLARQAAREMLARGEPSAEELPRRALALGRKTSAADAFVAASPEDAVRSRNLGKQVFRRVGVGVAVGDSPRYGAGLLWIAVVYSE